MNKWTAILTGLGVVGTVTVMGVIATSDQADEPMEKPAVIEVAVDEGTEAILDEGKALVTLEEAPEDAEPAITPIKACRDGEKALDVKTDARGVVSERVCLTARDYVILKENLYAELNTAKSYDFDINNREVLSAVLNRELEDRGITSFENIHSPEDLRVELIKLLQ